MRLLLEEITSGRARVEWRGVSYAEVLGLIRYSPSVLTTWRAGQTEEARLYNEAFEKLCLHAAHVAEGRWSRPEAGEPLRLEITTDPLDEPARSKGEAFQQERRWGWEESARKMVGEIRKLAHEECCSYDGAAGLYSDRRDVSPWRIRKATEFVEAEEKEESA